MIPAKIYSSGINVPGFFIRNSGQFDSHYEYCLKTASTTSYFVKGEVIHQFLTTDKNSTENDLKRVSLNIEFQNFNQQAQAQEKDVLPGKFNFFIGNDSTKWKTDVPSFQTLVYTNIYNSIDLVYHATNQFIENDFVVHPGGRIEDISIKYKGINNIKVNQQGDLIYRIDGFEFKEVIPEVYQMINGNRITINAKFKVTNNGSVSYIISKYDPNSDLIIDPQLIYSTYFGGTGDDYLYQSNIVKDSQGNIYFVGRTTSMNLPVTFGSYSTTNHGMIDVFVVKMNPTATQILLSTYIGGTDNDYVTNVRLCPPNNEIVVTGFTTSYNFPVTSGAYQTTFGGNRDGFLLKLNSAGNSLVFSTFLGSLNSGIEDYVVGLELNSSQQIYVCGYTNGDFPTTPGAYQANNSGFGTYDIFISKLNSTGNSLLISTMVGGSNQDRGYNLKLDSSDNVYIYGTSSGNFPITSGAFDNSYNGGQNDLVLFKMNSTLSTLIYSTYLGSNADEVPRGYGGLILDDQNQMIVTGNCGTGFPTTPGAYKQTFSGGTYDSFVTKMNSTFSNLVYSTYIGSPGEDVGYFLTSDVNNNIILSGSAASGFPTTNCSFNPIYNGGSSDAFVTKFNSQCTQILYSTYLGGVDSDIANAVWMNNDTALILGETRSSNIPMTANAYDPSFNGGGRDVFIAKLLLSENSSLANAGPDATICSNSTYTILNSSASNYATLQWTTSGTGTFSDPTILHPIYFPSQIDIQTGSVTLTLIAAPASSCSPASDGMILFINQPATANAGPDAVICQGISFTLNAASSSYASTYLWTSSGTGTFNNPFLLNPVYVPSTDDITAGSVILTLSAISNLSCGNATDAMILSISHQALVNAGPDSTICNNGSCLLSGATAQYAPSFQWTSSGSGIFNNPTLLNPVYFPSAYDITNGAVVLTINAVSSAPCPNVSDAMILHIVSQAIVSAGPDANMCESSGSYLLSGSSAQNATSILWTTSGSGLFNNASVLNPIYTPSLEDIETGSVVLTETGSSLCGNVSDVMILHITRQAIVNAGLDATICESDNYLLSGATSQYASSFQWTSSGSGTFNNPTLLNPLYYPSTNDIINGSVVLTLNATSVAPCTSISDDMILQIVSQAIVNAGPDANMCEASGSYLLSGSTAQNTASILWTTSGSGVFNNINLLNPIYTPSAEDIESTSVMLTETGSSLCGNVSDAMILNITHQALVNAGPDATICNVGSYLLSGATTQFATSYQWTTSGSGTFSNPNILNPIYNPSANDILNGTVTLILNTTSVSPCVGVSDAMNLKIINHAEVYAGPDDHMCESSLSYELNAATAVDAITYLWTTSGSGTFDNPTILNPVYTPSLADVISGSIILTETSGSACGNVADSMVLFISRQATVYAGPDATICESGTYSIQGATAQQAVSFFWNSTGDGFFNDPSVLNPVYAPGPNDIINGMVTLVVISNSIAYCQPAADTLILKINRKAAVNAGADDAICSSTAYNFTDAAASGYSVLEWSHNGLGVLNGAHSLSPTYTPTPEESGVVIFTLKATGLEFCADALDEKEVDIHPALIVVPPGNLETCEKVPLEIKGLTAQNSTFCSWTSSGSGIFDDPAKLNPVYTPSAVDVINGNVTFTVFLTGEPLCSDYSHNIMLTIHRNPLVDAGKDSAICENNVFLVNGAVASNVASIKWELFPVSAGVLTGETTVNPTFTPANGFAGEVHLKLTATGNPICGLNQVTDQLALQIIKSPEVDAGMDQIIPESTSISLTGIVNQGSGLYSWVWEPKELLLDPFIENPVSNPLNNDVTFFLNVVDLTTGCQAADSVNIITYHTAIGQLNIYNIITPNKDNKNDKWIIEGIEEFPENAVTILNRWGDKIREFTGYDNSAVVWDGTNNKNELVPDGTYYYILSVKNKGTRTGWVFVQGDHN
ncbi:MAG: gliding motility-associated C-terminal domain-containing protein [Bacteroidetes bacterium]|nr:gliding motility-associated C-terminal domain-containing protein [Bacteroidota bacterium]